MNIWREKLTIPYVKQIANGNLLYDLELKQGLCDNLDRWDGEGDGKEVWEGGDRVYLWLTLVDL